MKKQWITVEGRMTPIILPQIWNHELQDWVVTSEQNPLPTQVTGSIEEIYRQTSAEELQPSETWRVLDNEINRYKNISVFLRRVPGNADVRLRFITRSEHRGSFINQVEADTVESSNYVSVFQDKGVGIVYLIELVNVSSEPITVSDIVIMGRLT